MTYIITNQTQTILTYRFNCLFSFAAQSIHRCQLFSFAAESL
ncbi:hypothetical protein E2C01_026699 [Portunus trituberculatus]|uniref:Uncharacterized protein n=1 Tax=Portunus trituberculatus TaxID=210409 RepID=A0A5B7EJX2_PORTR|nr:hypothetical protein [Portunus trituberculatus]